MNLNKILAISILTIITIFGTNQIFAMEEKKCEWKDLPFDSKMDILKNLTADGLRQLIYISKEMKELALYELRKTGKPASFIWSFFKKDIKEKQIAVLPEDTRSIRANDSFIVTTSNSNIAKVWDVQTGKVIKELEGHTGKLKTIAISKDGSLIATGSSDNTIKLWDTKNFSLLRTLDGHTESIIAIIISTDNNIISVSYIDNIIKSWKVETGECIRTIQEGQLPLCIAMNSTGTLIASGGFDAIVNLRNTNLEDSLRGIYSNQDWITSIAINSNSSFMVTGSTDKTIKIWDLKTNSCLQTLSGHNGSISYIEISYDSSIIAAGSGHGSIKVWDVKTGKCLKTLQNNNNSYIRHITISRNNQYITTISDDNKINTWHVNNNMEI